VHSLGLTKEGKNNGDLLSLRATEVERFVLVLEIVLGTGLAVACTQLHTITSTTQNSTVQQQQHRDGINTRD
jgi:hypothetical protein